MTSFEESASPATVQSEQVPGCFLRWHGFVHQQQQRIKQLSGDLYLISVCSHKGRNGTILDMENCGDLMYFLSFSFFFFSRICPHIFCCWTTLCSGIKNRASLHRFFTFLALANPEIWRKGDFNWKSRCPTVTTSACLSPLLHHS